MTDLTPAELAHALGLPTPTPEQDAVIAAPLAPALVVAGAGSGKTETMASRVVWLVANGKVSREQILGLTFTRKAAGELAERIQRRLNRLDELRRSGELVLPQIAIDDADTLLDRPTVSTYNSFADGIVRENAVRLGRDPEVSVLSEAGAWLLMRDVVLAADDIALEDRTEALSSIIDAALRIARDGVDNLVPFDELAQFGDEFSLIVERPSGTKRTPLYADIASTARRVGGLPVLVALSERYQEEKRRRGAIDYSDQVAGAVTAVRQDPSIGAELRDRYRVVLLDEYQDTSVVQTDLLASIFTGHAVMAVGDPHQSIYGWRGASAGNLGDFAAAFGGGTAQTYTLLTSWRNSERVLEAANAILDPLRRSAAVEVGSLRPRPDAPHGDVEVLVAADIDEEAEAVAAWFDDLHRAAPDDQAPPSGAILFRSKRHMQRFADALGRRGLPHRILGLGGLLSTPEVVDVVAALRVVSDPYAGSALVRLLAGPRWGIGLPDLRELAELAARLSRHDSALQPLPADVQERLRRSVGSDTVSLVDALDFFLRYRPDHSWLSGFTPAARERLADAAATFADLRRAARLPIPELIRAIELELRLDIELAANESRGPARTAGDQLRAFVDEVRGFLATDRGGTLASLLSWLDRAERLDEFVPRTEPPEDGVVQLLTIHGSKGLEWDAVAIVRVVEDELPGRLRDGQGWLGFGILPYAFRGDAAFLPSLDWSAQAAPTQQELREAIGSYRQQIAERHLAEERRLMYVAVTRARNHLLITASPWAGTKTPRLPSVFAAEIAGAMGGELPDIEIGENPYQERRELLRWPFDALGARGDRVRWAASAVANAEAAEPDPALRLLLAEREEQRRGTRHRAPARIAASRFKDFVADYDAASAAVSAPMPERPYRQTRIGTLFHAWVEQRSGMVGSVASPDDALWESDDELPGVGDADTADLAALKQRFLASEWGALQPIEVESEINVVLPNLFGDGVSHVVICKLDAVYRREDRGGRIEIVDWKTGRAPTSASEREERMRQLDVYRLAYHHRHAVPMDEIDVVLYYVADDLIVRG